MVPIYRLNLSKSKRSERFRLCSAPTPRNRKATALGKRHYDDSEIKANFDSCAIGRKGKKCACATGKLSERDDSATKVLYKVVSYRAKSIAYQNDSEKLDKFRVKYIRDHINALLAYHYTFIQMKKLVFRIGKGLLSKAWH